jgi:signal transduction histidine kinase
MNQPAADEVLSPTQLLESVTRTLRHEVGDLLQTIYSTVAILQERVPPQAQLERRFLGDLRGRAETCKDELDAVHDIVLPIKLNTIAVDLAELAQNLVHSFAARYKSLEIRVESPGPMAIEGDGTRLVQIGRLLLTGACQSARRGIVVRIAAGANPNEVEWSIIDDGHGASAEQLRWLQTPFATTQQALWGLGLALAKKVTELHGGRVLTENRPDEGFRVSLVLPRHQAART